MDVLDKYKETWKNQPEDTNKLSKVDIYKMSHKRSTSIVKWIFIIGIAEFLFFLLLGFIPFSENKNNETSYDSLIEVFSSSLTVLSYGVSFYFLYHFYINYKSISIADNTKSLINQIVKTRKTVKQFIKFNIILFFVFASFIIMIVSHKIYTESNKTPVDIVKSVTMFSLMALLIIIPLYFFIKFYYHLLYGRLLDKLYYNHKELSKLDE